MGAAVSMLEVGENSGLPMTDFLLAMFGAGVSALALWVDFIKYPAIGAIAKSPIGKLGHLTVQGNLAMLAYYLEQSRRCVVGTREGELLWSKIASIGGLSLYMAVGYFSFLHYDPTGRFFVRRAIKTGQLKVRGTQRKPQEEEFWRDMVVAHLPQLPAVLLVIFAMQKPEEYCRSLSFRGDVFIPTVAFATWYALTTLAVWTWTGGSRGGVWPYPFLHLFTRVKQHVGWHIGCCSSALLCGLCFHVLIYRCLCDT